MYKKCVVLWATPEMSGSGLFYQLTFNFTAGHVASKLEVKKGPQINFQIYLRFKKRLGFSQAAGNYLCVRYFHFKRDGCETTTRDIMLTPCVLYDYTQVLSFI